MWLEPCPTHSLRSAQLLFSHLNEGGSSCPCWVLGSLVPRTELGHETKNHVGFWDASFGCVLIPRLRVGSLQIPEGKML